MKAYLFLLKKVTLRSLSGFALPWAKMASRHFLLTLAKQQPWTTDTALRWWHLSMQFCNFAILWLAVQSVFCWLTFFGLYWIKRFWSMIYVVEFWGCSTLTLAIHTLPVYCSCSAEIMKKKLRPIMSTFVMHCFRNHNVFTHFSFKRTTSNFVHHLIM